MQYDVRAVVPGDLMELNERLKTDASLLLRKVNPSCSERSIADLSSGCLSEIQST